MSVFSNVFSPMRHFTIQIYNFTSVSFIPQKIVIFILQLIMRTQDENMDLISKSVGSLKNMSQQIGNELEEQNV